MIDFIDAPDAGERHGNIQLLANDFDGRCDSGLAASTEAIDVSPPDQTAPGAEGKRAHDVLAGADAAIEHHLNFRAYRFGNSRQHRNRRCRAIELPPPVVGDDNRRRACLGRELGVLHVENAFDDQLAWPDAPNPLDSFQFKVGSN